LRILAGVLVAVIIVVGVTAVVGFFLYRKKKTIVQEKIRAARLELDALPH
jgi:hypothetical protein